MTRALAIALAVGLAAGAGCFFGPIDEEQGAERPCTTDPDQRFAADPATGICYEFATSCDVPPEWKSCHPNDAETCPGDAGASMCPASMDAGPAPLPECTSNFDCAVGEVCPAQYGGCSTAAGLPPDDGLSCPSYCEPPCLGDGDCAMGTVCNAAQVCGQGNPGGDAGPPPNDQPQPCVGWCVVPM